MIRLRPHHFMCILGFQGKGYSPNFVDNFWGIKKALEQDLNSNLSVQVEFKNDSICAACPLQKDQTRCTKETKIQNLDKNWAQLLDLKSEKVRWSTIKERIASRVRLEDFEKACHTCPWKSLGYCRYALVQLKEQNRLQQQITLDCLD